MEKSEFDQLVKIKDSFKQATKMKNQNEKTTVLYSARDEALQYKSKINNSKAEKPFCEAMRHAQEGHSRQAYQNFNKFIRIISEYQKE